MTDTMSNYLYVILVVETSFKASNIPRLNGKASWIGHNPKSMSKHKFNDYSSIKSECVGALYDNE